MASVYGSSSGSLDCSGIDSYLPLRLVDDLILSRFDLQDRDACAVVRELLNKEIAAGQSWPFEETMDEAAFTAYFLTRSAAFVVRRGGEIVGTFYVKPNFPGRCSGIANGGFIVSENWRGKGIGKLMGRVFLRLAKDLGFYGVVFNLVFATNKASIALWTHLKFVRAGTIPRCARLKGVDDLVDANIFHFNLEQYDWRNHQEIYAK